MATQLQDPLKRRTGSFANPTAVPAVATATLPTQVVRPTFMDKLAAGPRAFGGLPNAPAPGSAMARADAAALRNQTNVLGMSTGYNPPPQPLRPGEAAPDVNPQAAGTRFGDAVRESVKNRINSEVGYANAATRAAADGLSVLTLPQRALAGGVRDFGRALVGAAPAADSGQPTASVGRPSPVDLPFTRAPVNFALTHSDVPVRNPAAAAPAAASAAGGGGAPAAGPASTGRPTAAVDFSNVRGGVETTAAPAAAGGVTVTGDNGQPRHLNYGAMVNGVPTFSDGTGGIARTMSPEAMTQLAQERSISRANVGAAGNVLASDTLGGATPTQGQMVDQRLAQIRQPITGSRPSAAQFAEADRLAIASRDPRSAAGIAARNLSVDAGYARTPRLRRMAETALANLQAGTQQSALAGQQAEAQAADTTATGRNALDAIQLRGTLEGQNQLANTALEARLRPPAAGQQVQLADGTIGLISPTTGAITRATLPDGTVAKGQPKNPLPPIYTSAGGQAALQTLTNNILGVDPLTGMVPDKDAEGGKRLPTNAETFAAMQKAQQQLEQLGGTQPASTAQKAPAVGTVSGGYRFKGGDPASQSNWEKV